MTESSALVPYNEMKDMAKAVADSGLFGVKNVNQAVALMLLAQSEGIHPMTAARDYDIIQGRPSKKAEAMLRSFLKDGGKVKWIELTDKAAKAEFSHPEGGTLTLDWTIERAAAAGLVGKDGSMYKKYPRQMLRSRLISEGVRTVWPNATGGLYTPEEAQDVEVEVVAEDAPKIQSQPGTPNRLKAAIAADAKPAEEKTAAVETEQPEAAKPGTKTDTEAKQSAKPKKPAEKAKEPEKKTVQEATADAEMPFIPEGAKSAEGVVENYQFKDGTNQKTGKPYRRFSCLMDGIAYGTFSDTLAEMMERCMKSGQRIKLYYTERTQADKTFRDAVAITELDDQPQETGEPSEDDVI